MTITGQISYLWTLSLCEGGHELNMINHLSAKKMSNQFELAPKSNRLNS